MAGRERLMFSEPVSTGACSVSRRSNVWHMQTYLRRNLIYGYKGRCVCVEVRRRDKGSEVRS